MRNLKLTVEYDGRNYGGWQVQNHRKPQRQAHRVKTIQGIIEKSLRKILGENVDLYASGRTDAGVHALAQVANFKTLSKISVNKLHLALNGILPEDITIRKVEEVPSGFHSRFHARSKIYRYIILNQNYPSALLREQVYFYPHPLDLALMRKGARFLLGKHDFQSFCSSGSGAKNKVRTIKRISIKKFTHNTVNFPLLSIEIEADGFLYSMVRSIIGTLLDIGRGKLAPANMKKILVAADRRLAGCAVPARGLYLKKVIYENDAGKA